jgi:SWI/SNF-related matrix-associated actin-dependent regulator of chromatin subfamily A3
MECKRIKLSVDIVVPLRVHNPPVVPIPFSPPRAIPKRVEAYTREDEPEIDPERLVQCGVVSTPLPFQRTCIHFLNTHKNVALLDAMGLGKTFQVLCAIRSDPPSSRFLSDAVAAGRYRGNTLIVCPKIVQAQWLEQHAKHLKSTHKALAYTSKTASASLIDLCSHEIVVTTYDFLRSVTTKNASLVSIQWWRVVLDEAHCVKNHASKRFEYIDLLECTRRVALSGTPMHNTLTDLFPMLRFFRSFKGSLDASFEEWRRNVVLPLETNKKNEATEYVQKIIEPFVIRRLKSSTWKGVPLLSNMPRKRYATIDVRMSPEETKTYAGIEKGCVKRGILIDASTIGKQESAYDGFKKLHKLRLCCVASTLKSSREDHSCVSCEGKQATMRASCECLVCDSCVPVSNRCLACDAPSTSTRALEQMQTEPRCYDRSSKLQALETYVQTTPRNDKIIVFSSWVMVLDAIQTSCSLGDCARIDGSMSQTERMAQLARFRSTHRVLLMTFGAGSTGIDLTCANHVVFVDPHWSPAIEMQAEDRAYRIGQTKEVHIVHLIQSRSDGSGTIEQVIRGVQRRKRKAMNDIFPI